VIAEDMEFALVSVVIVVKEVENFRKEAKTKGFLVRDFTFEADQSEEMKENLEATKTEVSNKQLVLEEWCVSSYSEVRSSSMPRH